MKHTFDLMNFDWILFDADHTLFDFDKSAEESLADAMVYHGLSYQDHHWPLYNTINKQCWTAYENGEIDRMTMRTRRFSLFFDQIGVQVVDIDAFGTHYLNGLPSRPYFLHGAIDLLNHLHGRIRLGIITNGLTEVQRPRLAHSGVDKLFEVIVVSGEIGHMKPEVAFFQYTYDLMSCPPKARVLVIGDSLNADIKGGLQFGFKTCWFNPGHESKDHRVIPDYEIYHLNQIPEIIGL